MKINIEDVRYIAKLAKLQFDEEEAAVLAMEFENILKHFDNLQNENSNIQPVESAEAETFLRSDKVSVYENKKELFQNARTMRDGYLEIPKVIE